MEMLVKMAEVLVKIAVMMMASAAFRRHRKRGGESPPPSYSSLTFSLDGRRVSCGIVPKQLTTLLDR